MATIGPGEMCVWYDPNTTTAEEAMRITDDCKVSIEDAKFYDQNGKLYDIEEVFRKIEREWCRNKAIKKKKRTFKKKN